MGHICSRYKIKFSQAKQFYNFTEQFPAHPTHPCLPYPVFEIEFEITSLSPFVKYCEREGSEILKYITLYTEEFLLAADTPASTTDFFTTSMDFQNLESSVDMCGPPRKKLRLSCLKLKSTQHHSQY